VLARCAVPAFAEEEAAKRHGTCPRDDTGDVALTFANRSLAGIEIRDTMACVSDQLFSNSARTTRQ